MTHYEDNIDRMKSEFYIAGQSLHIKIVIGYLSLIYLTGVEIRVIVFAILETLGIFYILICYFIPICLFDGVFNKNLTHLILRTCTHIEGRWISHLVKNYQWIA